MKFARKPVELKWSRDKGGGLGGVNECMKLSNIYLILVPTLTPTPVSINVKDFFEWIKFGKSGNGPYIMNTLRNGIN